MSPQSIRVIWFGLVVISFIVETSAAPYTAQNFVSMFDLPADFKNVFSPSDSSNQETTTMEASSETTKNDQYPFNRKMIETPPNQCGNHTVKDNTGLCREKWLGYEVADGGAIKDLFGNIHDSVHKVREDVRSALHPQNKNKIESVSNDNDRIVFGEQPNRSQSSKSSDEKPVKTNNIPTVTTAPNVNGTSTEKDGRDNFAAGCATGYMRTPDGRCKPTF